MKLMIDNVGYNSKPTNQGVITNRIVNCGIDVTPQELAQALLEGKTVVPAYINTPFNGTVSRSLNCWTSQELIFIDFDNEIKVGRRKEKKITMTLDDAKREFADSALFIYTSFNHSEHHPKIRVVIRLDRVVTNSEEMDSILRYFKNKYTNADPTCFERSRMFFGGTSIYELDYNNRVSVSDILTSISNNTSTSSIIPDKNIENEKIYPQNNYLYTYNFVGRKTHNVESGKIFHSKADIYDYILKQDLQQFLKLENKNFCCIFHKETSPSANIFIEPRSKAFLYKCHSASCGFVGNIFTVVERMYKMNKLEAYRYLCDYFGVKLVETEWQKEQKEMFDMNIDYLLNGFMEHEYPELHKRIKKYVPLLIMLHEVAKRCIGSDVLKRNEEPIFFSSIRHLSEMCSKFMDEMKEIANLQGKINSDIKELNKRINLFAFLGIVRKIHESNVNPELVAKTKRIGKMKNEPNYYEIPMYSYEVLSEANNRAIEFKNKNMSMTGFSREMIERTLGRAEAERVFPMGNKSVGKTSDEMTKKISECVIREIESKGWTCEADVLKCLGEDGKGKMMQRQMKRCLNEILEGYDLVRMRANKENRKKYEIPEWKNGYVIVRMRGV